MTPEQQQRIDQIRERQQLNLPAVDRLTPEYAEAVRDIEFLLSFIKESQWQPIETAPQDGLFLVYMPDEPPHNKMQVARWHPNAKVIGHYFAYDFTKPTHWMPLPDPPQQNPPTNSP